MLRSSTTQERLAVLLILVQAGILVRFSETVVFPLLVVVGACAAAAGYLRLPLQPQHRILAAFALFLCFVVKWLVAPPYEPQHVTPFLMFPVAHAAAQFFLVLQVGQIACRRAGDALPPSLPLFSILACICAADVHATHRERFIFQICLLAFAVLTALYFSAGRQWTKTFRFRDNLLRSVLSAVVLCGVMMFSWVGSRQLLIHWDELERLIDRLVARELRSSTIGFDRESQLGSMRMNKITNAHETALRIVADVPPGYLRGTAYERLVGSRWHAPPLRNEIFPSPLQPPQVPTDMAGKFVFALRRMPARRWQPFQIWPDAPLNDTIFAPLNTAVVDVPVKSLEMDEHSTAIAADLQPAYGYTVFAPYGFEHEQLSDELRKRLSEVPEELESSLQELARQIFADRNTEREKVLAVEQYFRLQYEYSLDVQIPEGHDPLTYFLTNRPAAHCEYFASGATMLLRLAGVPTRYVTGFLASEMNPVGSYWIVRNRDAHAWCEAYLADEGWRIVETTPPAGIARRPELAYSSGLWDDFKLRIQVIRGALARGGIQSLGEAILLLFSALTTTTPGLVITGAAVVWLLFVGLRAWLPRLPRIDPRRAPFQRLLGRMDRQLKQRALIRAPSETLHQFAVRIRASEHAAELVQIADWYLQYAAFRYRSLDDPETVRLAIERLRETMPRVAS